MLKDDLVGQLFLSGHMNRTKSIFLRSCLFLLMGESILADPTTRIPNVKAQDAAEHPEPGKTSVTGHRTHRHKRDKKTKEKRPRSVAIEHQKEVARKVLDPVAHQTLKTLTHSRIALTQESLMEFEQENENAVALVDLMDLSNCLNATYSGIRQIWTNLDFNSWLDAVEEAGAHDEFVDIQNSIGVLLRMPQISLEDGDFLQQFVILIGQTQAALQRFRQAMLDPQFVQAHPAVVHVSQYLEGTMHLLNVMLARHMAQHAMNSLREAAENALGSMNSIGSVSTSVSIPTPSGVNVDVGVTIAADEGGGAEAFYQINNGQTLSIGISFGHGFKVALGVEFSRTQSLIFQCLEQVLDYGSSIQKLTSPDVMELNNSRKSMQESEREYLRRQGEFEGYLKILNVLPQPTITLWTGVTRSNQADERSVYGASLVESLSLGDFAEVSLTQTLETRNYTHFFRLLALLTEDCLPSDLTLNQLQRIVGVRYVFSDLTERFTPQVLCGFIEAYVSILEQLANPHATTPVAVLERKKHEYERLLLPRSAWPKVGHPGRLSILKALILAAAELRLLSRSQEVRDLAARLNAPDAEDASNDERRVMIYDSVLANSEIIFKKIYHQLSRLEKMQDFSKKYKLQAIVGDVVEAINRILKAGAKLIIPGVGEAQIIVQRNHETFTNRGQERLGGNIEFIVSTNASIVYIWQQIQAALRTYLDRLNEAAEEEDPDSERGRLIADYRQILNGIVGVGFPATSLAGALPTGLSVTSTYHIVIPLKGVPANAQQRLIALPGEQLAVRNRTLWVPQYVMTLIDRTTGLDIDASVASVSASATEQLQYVHFFRDCFTIWFTHFCSLYQGELYRKEADPKKTTAVVDFKKWQAWENACQEQLDALQNLMTNLTNPDSNAYYELQDHYNKILQNQRLSAKDRQEVDQAVTKLITACQNKKQKEAQYYLLIFLVLCYQYIKPLTLLN